MIRKIFRGLFVAVGVLLLVVAAMVGGIDRTPIEERDFYQAMKVRLDSVNVQSHGRSSIRSGWGKVNLTPATTMPMAGYIPRDHFDVVHDSLFARVMVVANDQFKAAWINVDLLIFPPALRDKINEELKEMHDSTFLYLSATHTHNGVGGWDSSVGGRLIAGKYSQEWIDRSASAIVACVRSTTLVPSSVSFFEADASEWVENRVNVDSGKVDGKIRGLRFERADQTSGLLFTYSAHATSIQKERLELSADYPGKVIQTLEQKSTFAMFMSGMVGSHRFKFTPENNYEFIDKIAPVLADKIWGAHYDSALVNPEIRSGRVPIAFGPAQLRLNKDWKLNNWAFRTLFRSLKGELTYLQIGEATFVATPCDFSGEIFVVDRLDSVAQRYGKKLIVTSFNGDYDGYITYDPHYEKSRKEEINSLNWVGPYYGRYFSEMIQALVQK